MTRWELIEYCLTFPGAVEDYPFEDRSNTIMRHANKGKWFALVFEKDAKLLQTNKKLSAIMQQNIQKKYTLSS